MIRLSDYESGLGDQDIRRTRFGRSGYIHLQVILAISCLIASVIAVITLISLYYMDDIRLSLIFELKNIKGLSLIVIAACVAGLLILVVLYIILCVKRAAKDYDESYIRVREYEATLSELIFMYENEGEEDTV